MRNPSESCICGFARHFHQTMLLSMNYSMRRKVAQAYAFHMERLLEGNNKQGESDRGLRGSCHSVSGYFMP